MKNKNRGIAPILIALFIAIIIGGGIYAVVKTKKQIWPVYPVPQQNQTQTQPNQKVSTISPDISSWNTYQNERYGFEFRYPAQFQARTDNEGTVYFQGKNELEDSNVSIHFLLPRSDEPCNATGFFQKHYKGSPETISSSPISLSDSSATALQELYENAPVKGISTYISRKDCMSMTEKSLIKIDQLTWVQSEEYKVILSTFKFTK